MNEDLELISAIVGADHVITAADAMLPYLQEWRGLFQGKAQAVVRPASTQEVAAIVTLANQRGLPIVPQGGNTGLVGGQIPIADGREIILSLRRMDKVRRIDVDSDTMIVEAGLALQSVQVVAEAAGRLFPLSLASEGSCTIGGTLSTNAGGTSVLAYGNARDLCLGLEVVLADGQVWNGLRQLRKDNTGYNLTNLFIGAEGTLGIITAAVLKLFPQPAERATAFIAVPNLEAALAMLNATKVDACGTLTAFEIISSVGLDFVLKHAPGARNPLTSASPWYVLVEVTSQQAGALNENLETLLETAMEKELLTDAAIAGSLTQRADFWKLREMLSEVQTHEGGSIKHDISVPLHLVPEFIKRASEAATRVVPNCRPVPFGHMGDGNIHFNVSQPIGADKDAFLANWTAMNEAVHEIVAQMHGSISAEHGIGRLKKGLLPGVKSSTELYLMKTLKAALDANNIMNPGAVL